MGKRTGRQRKQVKAYLRSPFEVTLPELAAGDQDRVVAALQACLAEFTRSIHEQKAQRSKTWAQQRAQAKEEAKQATATPKLSRSQRRRQVRRRRKQRRQQQQQQGVQEQKDNEGKRLDGEAAEAQQKQVEAKPEEGLSEMQQDNNKGKEQQEAGTPAPADRSTSAATPLATQHNKETTLHKDGDQEQQQQQQQQQQQKEKQQEGGNDAVSRIAAEEAETADGPQTTRRNPNPVLRDTALAFYRQRFVTGINAVTRALEKGDAEAVLLWRNVQPPMLVQHIPCMCHRKGVPLLPLDKRAMARVSTAFKLPRVSVLALCAVPQTSAGTPLSPEKLEQLHGLVRLCRTTAQPLDTPFVAAPPEAGKERGKAEESAKNLNADTAQAEDKAGGEEQLHKRAKAEDAPAALATAAKTRYLDMKLEVVEVTPKQKVNGRRVLSDQKKKDKGEAARQPKKKAKDAKGGKEAKANQQAQQLKEPTQPQQSKRPAAASAPPQTPKRAKQSAS